MTNTTTNTVKFTGSMKDKDDKSPELILRLEKPIWLAMTGPLERPESEIIGWTTTKPKYDNGFIDKGTVLVFSHIYSTPDEEEGLNFIMMQPGPEYDVSTAEFFQKEIDSLTKEGVFTLLRLENIDELSIILGEAFIKYSRHLSFDQVFYPKELYIIMGPEESKLSNYRIKVGEKMPLKRLLEIYSTALGQNLVLK